MYIQKKGNRINSSVAGTLVKFIISLLRGLSPAELIQDTQEN